MNVRIVQEDGFWTKLFLGLMIFAVLIYVAIYVALAASVLWLVFTEMGRSVLKFAAMVVITPFLLVGWGLLWLTKLVLPKNRALTPKRLARTRPASDATDVS